MAHAVILLSLIFFQIYFQNKDKLLSGYEFQAHVCCLRFSFLFSTFLALIFLYLIMH